MSEKALVIEALVSDLQGAHTAKRNGAHRLELCASVDLGGTSPTIATVESVVRGSSLPAMCMVRPRGGNFVYSEAELDEMLSTITAYKAEGAHGVVFGALNPDSTWNTDQMTRLVAASRPMAVTAHRAFDETPDAGAALEQLIDLGIERVLTSGQAATAPTGAELLSRLVALADDRIVILAGAGLTGHNYQALATQTGIREVHGSWWGRPMA